MKKILLLVCLLYGMNELKSQGFEIPTKFSGIFNGAVYMKAEDYGIALKNLKDGQTIIAFVDSAEYRIISRTGNVLSLLKALDSDPKDQLVFLKTRLDNGDTLEEYHFFKNGWLSYRYPNIDPTKIPRKGKLSDKYVKQNLKLLPQ